jgi:hypothetical protein
MDFPAFQKAFEEAVAGLIQEPAGKPSVAPANSKAGNGK